MPTPLFFFSYEVTPFWQCVLDSPRMPPIPSTVLRVVPLWMKVEWPGLEVASPLGDAAGR